jgi:hypothetical protein
MKFYFSAKTPEDHTDCDSIRAQITYICFFVLSFGDPSQVEIDLLFELLRRFTPTDMDVGLLCLIFQI